MHRSFASALGTAAALAFVTACKGQPATAPAAPPPAAAPAVVDEHLPPSVAGFLVEGLAIEPGDRNLPLITDGPLVVDPAARFRVVLRRRLPDARLVLVDGADALVPGDGQKELAEGTTLTLTPTARLEPGGLYVLRLDGAASREVHDEKGNTFLPMSVSISVAGAPEPPPPEPGPKARVKRKR